MLTILFVLSSLLLIGVSIPLIQRRVRPNPWYGFRTPKTLESETVWYDANEFSGRMLLRAGVITLIATIVLAFLHLPLAIQSLANTAVMMVSVLWATAVSFVYLQRL